MPDDDQAEDSGAGQDETDDDDDDDGFETTAETTSDTTKPPKIKPTVTVQKGNRVTSTGGTLQLEDDQFDGEGKPSMLVALSLCLLSVQKEASGVGFVVTETTCSNLGNKVAVFQEK